MIAFDVIQSPTWPFAEPPEGIPPRLFADANITRAEECSVESVLISAGCIWIAATVSMGGNTTTITSGTVAVSPGVKIRMYDAAGVFHGWFLIGETVPETLDIHDISMDLSPSACVPSEGFSPANTTNLTGDWTIEGADGVTVSHSQTEPLALMFGEDESWFARESPDDEDRLSGNGIYSINGLTGSVNISLSTGAMFPKADNGVLKEIVMVPSLVFFSDSPGREYRSWTTFPNIVSDHEWNNGHGDWVTETNGVFTVYLDGVTRQVPKEGSVVNTVNGSKRVEWMTTIWKGCDLRDVVRDIVRTSAEDNSRLPYPLDDVLNGTA